MNLCEMKFSDAEFVIDKAYAAKLRNKRATFARVTRTKKTLFLTLVTTYGVRDNDHAQSLGINSITMDALFLQIRAPTMSVSVEVPHPCATQDEQAA